MCGISACIMKNSMIDKERFERMVDIIEHRGPDDRGTYYNQTLALGHRRLSIIDLSEEGHQPFFYQDRYVLVFNGEIYNYVELKEELVQRGYRFTTQTDTEVLVAMYDCYGEGCVTKFNGMWSFVLYDKTQDKIFCSRDRFGIKPFYYWIDDDKFLIASEIKQILTMIDEKPKANNQKLLEFLLGSIMEGTENTMFQGVKQLLGGHNLIFHIKQFTIQVIKYYELKTKKTSKKEYEAMSKDFREYFHNSVKLRLRADVPVGYCLSGGLDSSAIVCMADEILKETGSKVEQHTVSSCFDDKRYDEQEFIDEVINRTKVTSHKIFPSQEELFAKVDKIIWHMDEPFGSTSIYAQWCVFEEAKRNHLKVMLDGQGADEQLAGYGEFYVVLLVHYLRKFQFIKFFREAKKYAEINSTGNKKRYCLLRSKRAIMTIITPNFFHRWNLRRKGYNNLPFSREIKERVYQGRNIDVIKDEKKYIIDSMQYGMASLLHYEDRDSMAHSIESRVPFLDYRLVELIYAMPFTYKIRNGVTKAVLRDGLKGLLPDKIITRYTKLGFVTPEDQWINNNFAMFREELEDACKQLEKLIDTKLIMDWFDSQKGKLKRAEFLPWRIICAGRWIKVFDVMIEDIAAKS